MVDFILWWERGNTKERRQMGGWTLLRKISSVDEVGGRKNNRWRESGTSFEVRYFCVRDFGSWSSRRRGFFDVRWDGSMAVLSGLLAPREARGPAKNVARQRKADGMTVWLVLQYLYKIKGKVSLRIFLLCYHLMISVIYLCTSQGYPSCPSKLKAFEICASWFTRDLLELLH